MVVGDLDGGDWLSPDILNVLGIENLRVDVYDGIQQVEILRDCLESESVGITCIQCVTNAHILVCLTTEKWIHVFKLWKEGHVDSLRSILEHDGLRFFIYKGSTSTYHLRNMYAIELGHSLDLSTIDIYISLRRNALNALSNCTPIREFYEGKLNLPFRDKVKLAENWLNIKLHGYPVKDKSILIEECYDETTELVIKKSAGLTRAIGLRMLESIDEMMSQDSANIYGYAIYASDEDWTEYENQADNSYNQITTRLNQMGV